MASTTVAARDFAELAELWGPILHGGTINFQPGCAMKFIWVSGTAWATKFRKFRKFRTAYIAAQDEQRPPIATTGHPGPGHVDDFPSKSGPPTPTKELMKPSRRPRLLALIVDRPDTADLKMPRTRVLLENHTPN
jgi:hypothetical protein